MAKLKPILIILFFSLMIFNFSTSPLPPPFHEFHISGNVICDTLADKSNFTITLYGKSQYTNGEFVKSFQYPYGRENLALTDSTGYYFLIAANEFEFDSVKTAIIIPGREPILSKAYFVDKSKRIEYTKYVEGNDNESGCCESRVTPQSGSTVIEKYVYNIHDIEIKLCE